MKKYGALCRWYIEIIRYTAGLVFVVATVAAIMESRTVIIGEY